MRAFLAAFALTLGAVSNAHAWGDKGHQAVALIAWAQMTPRTRVAVQQLLAGDTGAFKMHDGGMTSDTFDRQATWADYYRDSQRFGSLAPQDIHSYTWHFTDIEVHGGTLEQACFGFPTLPPGTAASQGQDPDCAVNKIEQFAAELASATVDENEKRLALKYLLHLVGDVHQPLHSADDADHGGNTKAVSVHGAAAQPLHHHWDVTFVELLVPGARGSSVTPAQIVQALKPPTAHRALLWQHDPSARRWALEAYAEARHAVYADLPAPSPGAPGKPAVYKLDAAYVANAGRVVALQIQKAGYRLAALLNQALGGSGS